MEMKAEDIENVFPLRRTLSADSCRKIAPRESDFPTGDNLKRTMPGNAVYRTEGREPSRLFPQ
jgi:hypothetical protein